MHRRDLLIDADMRLHTEIALLSPSSMHVTDMLTVDTLRRRERVNLGRVHHYPY